MQHRDNPEKAPLSDAPTVVEDRAADYRHASVLLDGAVEALMTDPDGCYLDGTFGRGGHSRAILQRLSPQGRLLAIDRDPAALAEGATWDDSRFTLRHGRFAELDDIARDAALHGRLSGVLLDVGVSSPQLDDASRGFSFLRDGPLDMRMDPTQGESAADWLARVSERDMSDVFKRYGEERFARRIAKAIVARRGERPITHTADLAELVKAAHPAWEKGKHPATRVFQAIRIHVNGELDQLEAALAAALESLAPGGRLVVISFHSLEDRLVKRFIRDKVRGDTHLPRDLPIRDTQLNRRLAMVGKARRPDEDEIALNPRARSAVMRVAQKLG
ncbi:MULTISPECIES: 16S rRNA (cytosine(1402)-N(4))-methyltransferase RsmH [Chromohalobacter]|uniref:16S rRNA (cytosine(1402)-N(4))-methyltransferase RsmH n=1 Tax=Chromohalobacter TaxID=42054 RepID=UPI00068B8B25|nr:MULTISPECIES: 16S rRNA (cytosine(1402)-N(4))-methyltransferase RsmH [Chromohalobacter]MDF9433486.1 16S rRNA (cytosine(1402)-N(4))-methyltransferase RsmH [Chromohalobacter israelensis]PWW41881.1 16S rRNA (cytosine1402-N4)-methyltransferase [Chromohalobacter salexigens]